MILITWHVVHISRNPHVHCNATFQVPSNGKTPLILALETRDFSLVTEILDRLNPDRCRSVLLKQTRSGDTCLHIAAGLTNISSEQKEWLLRLLVTKGANGNIPNNAKEYPKDFARKEVRNWQASVNSIRKI